MLRLKSLIVFFVLVFSLAVGASAAPRGYGDRNTATDVNTAVTFAFYPSGFCIENQGTSNELFYDFTDGVATTDDTDSTNIYLAPGKEHCYNTNDPNVTNTFVIGIICSSAETTTYAVRGIHR